ncbi:MAG: UDP-galactopyranose mutase [Oligoflexia bacterium]|nr:UDP-galactopyranose mutase [Oligoflexia bacterium]
MDLSGLKYLVVGSGIWGSVFAERIATSLKEKVLVIDKNNFIGGHTYTKIHPLTGIECHLFGTHIFHTSIQMVWDYISKFTELNDYQHKVLIQYKNHVYSMPINLGTINNFYRINLRPSEATAFINEEINKSGINFNNVKNLEEKAISLIGRPLYEAFIKGYTQKQWEKDLRELPSEIITRLPVRNNYNANYFSDLHQGVPKQGYFKLFENILKHDKIDVELGVDYFDIKHLIPAGCTVIYTGSVDQLFDYKFGRLEWRTVRFEEEIFNIKDYQGTSVLNYGDLEIPYTRIHEFKHLNPERDYYNKEQTVIFREYSKTYTEEDEPYYPINTPTNNNLHKSYMAEAEKIPKLIIGGRLGLYSYWDLDKAIENSLNTFANTLLPK